MDAFTQINANIEQLRSKAALLPTESGVYIMKSNVGKIIYIGKAKVLKNRVNQYFHSFGNLTEKTVKLVGQIADFDYVVTASEFEALLLECSLIKQYKPRYNILLKDDKGMHYIRITAPPWSKIERCHRKEDDGAEYIGPFPSSYTVRTMVEEAQEIFALPTCNRTFGDRESNARPCLNYFIRKCYGPCKYENANPVRHAAIVDEVRRFLREGGKQTLARLTSEMEEAAENLEFERAAALRDRIKAIESFENRQKVVSVPVEEADAIAASVGTENACVAMLSFRNHRMTDKQHFKIEDATLQSDRAAALRAEFLLGYYAEKTEIPALILLDEACEDMELLERLLSEKRGGKVKIIVPQKGDNRGLVEMAATNASEQLVAGTGKREAGMLSELSRLAGLAKPADYIEAYDISHTAGTDIIAGMVVYAEGKPKRSNYRQFIIRESDGADDCGSLREAVRRRYLRQQNPQNKDEAFAAKPDLILADGGRAQANAILQALAELGIADIPVLGMVKDSHHKTRGLVCADGGELEIRSARGAFALLTAIQDEVHRYVITCHRNRRSKQTVRTVLSNIPEVGPKRITALMEHFKTIEAIAKATEEEIAAVPGMSKQAAYRTKRYFSEEY